MHWMTQVTSLPLSRTLLMSLSGPYSRLLPNKFNYPLLNAFIK